MGCLTKILAKRNTLQKIFSEDFALGIVREPPRLYEASGQNYSFQFSLASKLEHKTVNYQNPHTNTAQNLEQ